MQPRFFDLVACSLLLADVDVELARRRVVRADHHGLVLLKGTGERIFPGELAQRGQP